jgi:hypothetical protein
MTNSAQVYIITKLNVNFTIRKMGFLNIPPRRAELEWWYGEFPDFPPDIFFRGFLHSVFVDFLRT